MTEQSPADPDQPPAARPLQGLRVLLVEDNPIIAMDAEDILRELGCAEVMTATTIARAEQALAAQSFDLALLDIGIGDDTSYALADRLAERGIPYLFATGHPAPTAHNGATPAIVPKPYSPQTMARAIERVLGESGRD